MENTRTKTTRNSLILLLTAAIWGMAFVSQSKGMDYMHPFTFNGVRSLIGAASILVYILRTALRPEKLTKSTNLTEEYCLFVKIIWWRSGLLFVIIEVVERKY